MSVDIDRLLRRAAPLAVSAGSPSPSSFDSPARDGVVAERLRHWREAAARNDDARFAARLAWDGLTPETAAAVVSGERPLRPGDEWWATAAGRLIRYLEQASGCENQAAPESSIPFAPVLMPLICFATGEVAGRCGWALLPGSVVAQLRASLCRRLSTVSHRTLGAEFRQFREARPRRDGAWSAFVEQILTGGWPDFLERFPVLARLLGTVIAFWIEDTAEFLNRLEGDRAEIAKFLGEDPGEMVEVECDLSDPHRGARRVRIVGFASGARIVYKPRNLDTDLAWRQWMEWLRERDRRLDLRAPGVLHRGEWGWVECMRHDACEDLAAVERFYWRAGCLLCLLHATASDDFHDENLLACGEYPVPVDLETIFTAERRPEDGQSDASRAWRTSVLWVGMLPGWKELQGQSDALEISALGATRETQPVLTYRSWVHANSDEMEYVVISERRRSNRNMPWLHEGPCPDAGQFVDQMVAGFRATYEFLLAHRDALLDPAGPIAGFRRCRSRIVLRPTEIYGRMWERSLDQAFLSRGVDRSIELEGLSRHYLASEERHGTQAMFRAEVAALEQLDIPLFEAGVESAELFNGDGQRLESNGLIPVSGYETVRGRLTDLSAEDCDFQSGLIRASFAARALGALEAPASAASKPALNARREPADSARHPESWRAAAGKVACSLKRQAIWSGGEACWLGLEALPVSRRVRVQLLGPSLYGGSTGLALFLAARFALEGDTEDRAAALGVVRYLRHAFLQGSADHGRDPQAARAGLLADGIGGAFGGGSTIYGLLRIGGLLGDTESVENASSLARLLDDQAISADRHLDVIRGAAGAILVLLALWRETQDSALIEKALLCGEHLLRSRVSHEGAPRAWRTIAQRPLAGFSHGAAGIGLALLRLHQVSPDIRFRDAALEGFAYERTLFSPEACNWTDRRDGFGDGVASGGWCHGAPGIALARLAALEIVEDPLLRADLECGLQFLRRTEAGANDTLCCGEIGKADILLEAGRRLNRPELIALANQRASSVAAAGLDSGGGIAVPGLFQGIAGVGYGLLRQAAPERLPCILLWD